MVAGSNPASDTKVAHDTNSELSTLAPVHPKMNQMFKKSINSLSGSIVFIDEITIYGKTISYVYHDLCVARGILNHKITLIELFQELLEHIGENQCDIKLSHYVDMYNPGGEWYAGESTARIIRIGENKNMDKIKIGQIVRLLSNNPCEPRIVDVWYLEAGKLIDTNFVCESIKIRIHTK